MKYYHSENKYGRVSTLPADDDDNCSYTYYIMLYIIIIINYKLYWAPLSMSIL